MVGVRRARDGEEMRTLDGRLRRLDHRDMVIKDGERAIALAAIMGGAETEITESTTSILLEAANFEPISILHTSERLALRTEGSNRWEKGVDPYLAEHAARLATQLIVETSGARWVGETDAHAALPERPRIELRPERTSALLGLDVPAEEQRGILRRLQFDVDGDTVTVPTWRARDVTREADLIEEVARFVLDDVPFTLPPRREAIGRLTREQQLRRAVEDVLAGCGLSEAYTPSLVGEDPDRDALRLPNPLSSDQSILRTTLLPSLLAAAERNRSVGNERVALFEIAHVYLPTGEQLPDEPVRVAGVLEGGYADAKGVVDTLFEALKIEPQVERGDASAAPSRQDGEARAGLGRRGPSRGRDRLGGVRARPRRPCSPRCPSACSTRTSSRSRRCSRISPSSSARTCRPPRSPRRCARPRGRRSGRWSCSTSTGASRSVRASARSRSASPSARPTAR